MGYSSSMRPPRAAAALAIILTLAAGGCENLTSVKATDVVDPDALGNASGAETLYNGAIGTFTSAFAAYPLAQFLTSGLISDEFITAPPQGSWASYDFRTLADPGETWPYVELQKARIAALEAIHALQTYAPEPSARVGEMFAHAAYVETILGENMCSGVPLSSLVNQAPVYGPQLTTTEMFERAVADFDSALAYAGGDARVQNLASVGKGRALLSLGRYAEAAGAVAEVPTDFLFQAELVASSSITSNGYHYTAYRFAYLTIVDGEGGNGLNYISANDPRVEIEFVSEDGAFGLPFYRLPKYSDLEAPVELASGIEARLIEAEAAYQADPDDTAPTGSGWLGILNDLRATAIEPAMPALADPGTRAAREDLIFRERAFWTFATGRRHGDMRRLVREYGRAADTVFPTGTTIHGIPYGDEVTFAPPVVQFNNPDYTGCFDRDA